LHFVDSSLEGYVHLKSKTIEDDYSIAKAARIAPSDVEFPYKKAVTSHMSLHYCRPDFNCPLNPTLDKRGLTPLSHIEVGCSGTWGTGTADPKPKQPEHPRAYRTCNPAMCPACQKKPSPSPRPSTCCIELEEQWKTY